jgi:hypothetical protein
MLPRAAHKIRSRRLLAIPVGTMALDKPTFNLFR